MQLPRQPQQQMVDTRQWLSSDTYGVRIRRTLVELSNIEGRSILLPRGLRDAGLITVACCIPNRLRNDFTNRMYRVPNWMHFLAVPTSRPCDALASGTTSLDCSVLEHSPFSLSLHHQALLAHDMCYISPCSGLV